jgi:hypothetical protein
MSSELLIAESRLILARESTSGTDAIDLANNLAIARRYAAFTKVDVKHNLEFRERNILRPTFSSNRGQVVPLNQTWSIEGIVPCPSTAGNAPLDFADLLVFCGANEALVGDTTATYTFLTTAQASGTAYYWKRYVDTYVWLMTYGTGIRGGMTIKGSVNDYSTFAFTGDSNNFPESTDTAAFRGWSAPLAFFDSGTPSIALDKTGAAIVYSGTETTDDPRGMMLEPTSVMTIDSVAFPISAYEISLGNAVTPKQRTSATAGVSTVLITGRGVTVNLTLEQSGTALRKALTMLHADSEVSATLVQTDGLSTGGSTLTSTFPKLQARDVEGPTDSEGLAAWTLPFQANGDHVTGSSADDEFSMVWSVTA